jgi:hypothetical protein
VRSPRARDSVEPRTTSFRRAEHGASNAPVSARALRLPDHDMTSAVEELGALRHRRDSGGITEAWTQRER